MDREEAKNRSTRAPQHQTNGRYTAAELGTRRRKLAPEVYNVCFEAGTEPPFSGKYYDHHEVGIYKCVVCGSPLFKSDTKFDSGSGWPSFWDAKDAGAIKLSPDVGQGMIRTEVRCANCDSHLGHVFEDGPAPTYKRYCINSVTLEFEK